VEFKALFHLSDAESISLAESNTISAITASTPYSGRPIGVVKEIALVVLAMLEAAALDIAELVTAALDTTLVSIFYANSFCIKYHINSFY